MANDTRQELEAARTISAESIPALLSSPSESLLRALIDNPSIDESHICLLLKRKDLPATLLEEIARRKEWRANHRVSRALAENPHTPRLVAMRLLRDLHLMDLVHISTSTACRAELRRVAEERVLTQLPQLPLGQRRTLARRGSSRIAGGLVALGPDMVVRIALDNSRLTESQLLKVLAMDALAPRTLAVIAAHEKWAKLPNVRTALIRHRHAPLDGLEALVADLPQLDLVGLLELSQTRDDVRELLRRERERRKARETNLDTTPRGT